MIGGSLSFSMLSKTTLLSKAATTGDSLICGILISGAKEGAECSCIISLMGFDGKSS